MSEHATFVAFVHSSARALYGTAYVLCGSQDAAEELVQETLAALYPKWELVDAAESPLAYVRRAMANRFVSTRRRPASQELVTDVLPDRAAGDDHAEATANRLLLWQLLGGLPRQQRAALVLRYLHDQRDEDIAAALGCKVATVRSLVSRGVVAMRRDALLGADVGGAS